MEPNLTLFWNPCGRRHTVAVSRNLARGGLTVLAVDIDVDVDIGASGGGPGHPTLAVHPALAGKAHDQRGHDGRNPDHDRGDGRNDDRHRFGLRRRGAEQSAGHESGGQTNAPATACVVAHGDYPFPIPSHGRTRLHDLCCTWRATEPLDNTSFDVSRRWLACLMHHL